MKAASLGHQYLILKSLRNSDSFLNGGSGGGRFRGSQRNQIQRHENEEHQVIVPATVPLSRRSTIREELSTSEVATITRSLSDPENPYVVSPSQEPLKENVKRYSLVSIRSRRGSRDDNDKLSGPVKKFYRKQDDLIDAFEEINEYHLGKENTERAAVLAKKKRHIEWLIRATLVCNCSLLIAKIAAAVLSKSLSIISSVVDSVVDSASACLLFWAVRAIKRRDPYTYPGGRTRLEPLIIAILSVIMVSASVQVIYTSVQALMSDINGFNNNSTNLRDIDMGPVPITVMCVTIVCKAVLSFLCFQISNPTMKALAQDHLNDVFTNIVALVCGTLASKALDGVIKTTELVVIDPVGAIAISLYIIFCWLRQLRKQMRYLTGYKAEPEFLQKITWLTLNHSPLIKQIDTVRAFHFGISFLVEVELILPESMTLKDAHNIGDSLKIKLEKLPEVELAFVHLDYTVDTLKY